MLTPSKLVNAYSPSPGLICVMSGLFLLLSAPSFAAAQQPPPGGRGGPPPEAFTACENLTAQDMCTVEARGQTLSGQCQAERGGERQLCVPEGHNENRENRAGPPHPDGHAGSTRPHQRPAREHNMTQSPKSVALYPAFVAPITSNRYDSEIAGEWRTLKANSISVHKTGEFPNPDNPNTIAEQNFDVRIPAHPVKTDTPTRVKIPGYGLNGVSFDPGAGEFYKGDPSLGWQYEALSGAVPLGLDANHAHVQPSGKYHYHGLPTGLMDRLGSDPAKHSPQIGWAVDGFPIYALRGYESLDAPLSVTELKSSYRLKSGPRPTGINQPGGTYDGTFTGDYEYIEGLGDLDACNGRVAITPDFPNGTYAYFLTQTYPVIPRCVMGTLNRQAAHH